MVNVEQIKVEVSKLGHITNSYVVYDDEKNAVVIDPGDEAEKIISFLKENELKVKYIFITHVHADHIAALEELVKYAGCKVVASKKDVPAFTSDELSCANILNVKLPKVEKESIVEIEDGFSLSVGNMEFSFMATPGHTPGSMCIYEKKLNSLFSGDTLFANAYGRCDLPGSSFEDMKKSLNKIFENFSDDVTVYSGHGHISSLSDSKKRVKLLLAIKR